MRAIKIGLVVVGAAAVCGALTFAQVNPPLSTKAATNQQMYWSAAQIQKWVQDGQSHGESISVHPMEGSDFSFNIVHREGSELPQIHAHETDLYVIQTGECISLTGGELVGPITTSDDGDRRGTAIKGGTRQSMKAGDVVFIPPGVPHMNEFPAGSHGCTYFNIHFPGN
jgi:hypothetical protein